MILLTEKQVKDQEGNTILDAIAARHGYTGFVKDENGDDTLEAQSKQEFFQNYLLDHALSEATKHITATAAAASAAAAADGINSVKDELKK